MKKSDVINDLREKTMYCKSVAEQFKSLSPETLKYSSSEQDWNILQCLEHNNRYGKIYIKEFKRVFNKAQKNEEDIVFAPGFLGKKFTAMMLPEPSGKVKKMNTFKSKNPAAEEVSYGVIDEFIHQQNSFLELLNEAMSYNINGNKCKLTLPLLKMNLGSTLQFIIFHNVRHIEQAKRKVKGETVSE